MMMNQEQRDRLWALKRRLREVEAQRWEILVQIERIEKKDERSKQNNQLR